MSGDERRARRDERRALRVSNRRSTQRQNSRADRQAARQDARGENVGRRQDTRAGAYEQGINPNQFVSDLGQSVGSAAESYFENQGTGGMPPKPKDWSIDLAANQGSPMMPYIIAGAGLIILMSMKKK